MRPKYVFVVLVAPNRNFRNPAGWSLTVRGGWATCLSDEAAGPPGALYPELLVVILSRPWPWGPVSRRRSKIAKTTPKDAKAVRICSMGR